MPFGLSGASATFQRLMDQVFRGTEELEVYLDDIIIYEETWRQHLDNVRQVFERLKNAGLIIKPKKCSFGVSEYTYLGDKIEKGGVRPEETKVKAMTCLDQERKRKSELFLEW